MRARQTTDPSTPLVSGAACPARESSQEEDLIQQLQQRIRRVETARRADANEIISSGCEPLDQLLPEKGYPPGCLVQWFTGGGCGADYLSLLAAREACRSGQALVIVDPDRQFYPPTAAAIGIEMRNLIVLQLPRSEITRTGAAVARKSRQQAMQDLLWSVDQALRCSAVGAVWGTLGQIDERWFRRFQLSAESSGCLGLLVQSLPQLRQPSWAEVQWLVEPVGRRAASPSTSDACQHHVRVQLIRCRGTHTGKRVDLTIRSVDGQVRRQTRPLGSSHREVTSFPSRQRGTA